LIKVEPLDEVVGDALYDELPIQGSDIDNEQHLLDKLWRAVTTLSPYAAVYLIEPAREDRGAGGNCNASPNHRLREPHPARLPRRTVLPAHRADLLGGSLADYRVLDSAIRKR
jgi:hypothetical protein